MSKSNNLSILLNSSNVFKFTIFKYNEEVESIIYFISSLYRSNVFKAKSSEFISKDIFIKLISLIVKYIYFIYNLWRQYNFIIFLCCEF